MANELSAPLPDITWKDQSLITVDAGAAGAKVTKLTIHLAQDVPDELVQAFSVPPIFAYAPEEP